MPQSICERKSINPGFLPTKQQLVSALVDSIDTSLKQWSAHTLADVTELCTSYHKQFLELKARKVFLEMCLCKWHHKVHTKCIQSTKGKPLT